MCGLTNLGDAELAVELGAWALGMIFYPASPRRCSIEQARLITTAMHRRVELCGVFVNAPLDEVADTTEALGLTVLQLHGDEGPSYCAAVAARTGARICKARQVSDVGDIRSIERFHVDYHLLDTRSTSTQGEHLRGGTGETFDWSMLSARHSQVPLILSGGLHASNVADAILATDPFAVDSASGTESAPGHKDPDRMRAFFTAVEHACAGSPA